MLLYVFAFPVTMALAVHLNICIVKQEGYEKHVLPRDLPVGSQMLYNSSNTPALVSTVTLNASAFSSFLKTECTVFNTTCTGLMTYADCSHAKFVDHWAESQMIPSIIFTDTSCSLTTSHSVRLFPHYTIANMLVTDVLEREKWTDVIIFYDTTLDMLQQTDLINRLSDKFVGSTVIDTIDLSSTSDVFVLIGNSLEAVKLTQYKHLVVIATNDIVNEILIQAHRRDMLGRKFYWIILSDGLLYSSLKPLLDSGSNAVVLKQRFSPGNWDDCKLHPPSCILYSQDEMQTMMFYDAIDIFQRAVENVFYMTPFDNSSECEVNDDLKATRRNITTSMMKMEHRGRCGLYKFDKNGDILDVGYDIYSTHNHLPNWFQRVGDWSMDKGLRLNNSELFENTFRSFKNASLLIGSQEAKPFVIKNVEGNRTFYTGFCIDILDELALRFDFSYTIVEPDDHIWGAPIDDKGNWNGIVGMVVRKELSMGVGPFTITSIRESVIDFTKPFMEDGVGLITKRPDGESQKMFKTFTPFAPIVWGCIVIAVVVVSVTLYLVNKYSPYAAHKKLLRSSDERQVELMSLKTTMWLIYGSYMEQGGDPHPNSVSGRLILGFWWLFTILMVSTYTANLAAFLTVSIAEKPINSLAELAGQTEIKPLVKFGSNLYSLFKDADGGVYSQIWKNMEGFPIVKNNSVALSYVDDGSMAYMTDWSQLEYILLHDCEKYSLADEIFNTAGYGFVVPENSQYLEAFNYNIMKMQEAGLIDKWRQRWWPKTDKCSGSDRTSVATILDLDSLAGPFLVYASVAAVAFICLFLELLIYTSKLNIFCEKLKMVNSKRQPPPSTGSGEIKT